MSRPILEQANEVIYGDREQTYGDPGKNLRIIASYWNTYLTSKGFTCDFLDGLDYMDVANMMVLLKVARLGNTPLHNDSMVDACGYLALADRVHNADIQAKKIDGVAAPRPGASNHCNTQVKDVMARWQAVHRCKPRR